MLLRPTARVIDARTGVTRRTVKLDGTLADLFDLQDQIGATVLGRPVPLAAEAGRAVVSARELVPPDATSASQSGGEVSGVLEQRGGAHTDSSTERESVRMRAGFAAAVQGRPTTVITRVSEAPRIDGLLDDVAWDRATRLAEFVQIAPVEGATGSEETEVWLAYDDRYQQGTRIGDALFITSALLRTNRAVFAKVSYLFRY